MTPTGHLRYRPEVDGLRALAVVPVILFHAGFDTFRGGFVGVDIFFVISGYLITTILLSEKMSDRFTLVGFYERRARRILPALFFVILACIPFAWLRMTPDEVNELSKSIVGVALFSSNIFFWLSSGYFDTIAEEKLLLHTWSLGVEEQYYLFFPLLLMATWRFGQKRQIALLAALAAVSLLMCEWGSRNTPSANFYLLPSRAWELLIGSILAFLCIQKPLHERLSARSASALAWLGFALILLAILTISSDEPFPSHLALLPTIGTALVLAYANSQNIVGRTLSTRPFVFIGLISYSAYLWHQPLFAMARLQSTTTPSPWVFLGLSLASLALAYFTWRVIERPFRDRRALGRRPIFIASLAGTLLFLGLGTTGALQDGFPSRLDATHRTLLETAASSPRGKQCHSTTKNSLAPEDACIYFLPRVTWAALGDSHMVEMAVAVAEQLADKNEGLLHLTYSGCPPAILYESPNPGCSAWQREALERIEANEQIRDVIVGFRYSSALFGDQLSVYPEIPNRAPKIGEMPPQDAREIIWESFTTIVDRLLSAGKRVHVLGPVPELDKDIRNKIVSAQFKKSTDPHRGTTREWYDRRNAFVLERLRKMPWNENLVYIDPSAFLCDSMDCYAILSDQAMYFDDDHLSVGGARKLALVVVNQHASPTK